MPTQSDIQSLLQRQTGLQTTAQGSVPSAVNNGNPNTVYNTPWGQSFANTPPPPMTTANGQWYIPQTQPGMFNPWTPPAGQTVQPTQIVWPTPQFLPPGGAGGGGTGPTTGGPNPPAPVGTGGGVGGGGGGEPDPAAPTPSRPGNYTPGQPGWQSLLNGAGIDTGQPGTPQWNRSVEWSNAVLSRLGGAREQNGQWDWRQIVDMVTEPLLGGNLWLSGTNQWDASNGIAALVQAVTGIPLGNIMNKLGAWQATQNDPADSWLEKLLVNHWEDNAQNDVAIFQDTLNRYLQSYGNFQTDRLNNQTSNINTNWMNTYTNAMVDAMLKGLTGKAATDYAKGIADAAGRNPSDPGGGATGGLAGGGRGGGGPDIGWGVTAFEGGCVVVDNYIEGYDRADEVKVDDLMIVADPLTFERKKAHVSMSRTILRPCVRLKTKHGVVLECSVDAEIADEQGNRIQAVDLLGVPVPTIIDGVPTSDIVMDVEYIGQHPVQEITAENLWYLAGKTKGKYLFHHNTKYYNDYGNRTTASGWQGSGSIHNWAGLQWGW